MNKKLLLGMFALFFVLLSIQSVYAIDILDSVLQPFKGTDVGKIYDTYSLFIDAVLYLLLFLGLAQLIYVKIYGKKEGKLVAIAVGLALTFAMALLESKTGFRLSALAPLASIILIFVLFILLYNLFESMFKDAGASFSLAFLIMYGFLMSLFSPLYKWLETNAPLLAALVQIAMIASFVVLIIKLIGMFKGSGDSSSSSTSPTAPVTPGTPPVVPPAVPNKITITSPSDGQNFNAGDYVRIGFDVSGPELMKDFDYEVRLDNGHFASRVTKVRGNQVWPFPTRAGVEIPAGRHALYVVAFKRGWISGGSNKIITQSNVIEINVGPGGGGGGAPVNDLVNLITNNLEDSLNRLAQAFIEYQRSFNAAITLNASGRAAAIDWATLIRNRQTLLDELGRVNDTLDAIYLHTSYGLLTPANLAVLAARVNRSNILRVAIIDYEIAAITDFNLSRMPSRPTP